jgi:hypothetical protein
MATKDDLSPEAERLITAWRREINRLHGLADRWLGSAILKLARQARGEMAERLGEHQIGFEAGLVWSLVPELARRLGETQLEPRERIDWELSVLDGRTLRRIAGLYAGRVDWRIGYQAGMDAPSAWMILTNDIPNGNAVIIALDRVAPPDEAADDLIAETIRATARVRGKSPTSMWSPGLQQAPAGQDANGGVMTYQPTGTCQ